MKIYSKSYSKHISDDQVNEHIAKTINNTTTYIHNTITKYLLECIVDICAQVGYNITANYEEFQLTIFDTSFYLVVGTTNTSGYKYPGAKGVTCITTEVVPNYNTNSHNNFLSGSENNYYINIQLDVYATDNLLWVTYKYNNSRYTTFAIAKGFSIDRQENAIAINKGHVLNVNSQNEQNCTMSTTFSFCSWWSVVDSSGITRAITFNNIWTTQPWSKDKLLLVPIIDDVGLFKFDELYHANPGKLYNGIPYTSGGNEYICWSGLCIMGGPDTLVPKS